MKRLLHSGSGRSASMDHQDVNSSSSPFIPSRTAFGNPNRVCRSRSIDEGDASSTLENVLRLPSQWMIQNDELRSTDPSSVRLASLSPGVKTTIYADRPLPSASQFLKPSATNNSGWAVSPSRRRNGDTSNSNSRTSSIYPTLNEQTHHTPIACNVGTQIYYFELNMSMPFRCSSPNCDIMIGFVDANFQAVGVWPGEVPISIGWGTDGLYVGGKKLTNGGESACPQRFMSGDVIGCGIEMGGMQRVFYTRNGRMVIPPSALTAFLNVGSNSHNSECYPVIAFQNANGDGFLKANFGLDSRYPFLWHGSTNLDFLVLQPAGRNTHRSDGHSSSTGSIPTVSRTLSDTSRMPSPNYGLDSSRTSTDPLIGNFNNLTRSVGRQTAELSIARNPTTTRYPLSSPLSSSPKSANRITQYTDKSSSMSRSNHPIYGTQNSKTSLEDDDPSANVASEHLKTLGGNDPAIRTNWCSSDIDLQKFSDRAARDSVVLKNSTPGASLNSLQRLESSRRRREERNQQRRPNGIGGTPVAGTSVDSADDDMARSSNPAASFSPHANHPAALRSSSANLDRMSSTTSADQRTSEDSGAATDTLHDVKLNSRSLLEMSKREDIDPRKVSELLEQCQVDHEMLQHKLSNVLEDTDAIVNLEDLFGLNDEICYAIEAGKNVLKRENSKGRTKLVAGPSIKVLVENQDVFSLICMLRAPNEKRLQAALALMTFAKENDTLRNEISSSGGMHSFLTLFRARGMTRELLVVASMAVAHTLQSFVASSQISASVGLKIVECLRFLIASNPVSPNGVFLSRETMCHAASTAVILLWVNAIQPLITMEKVKIESRQVIEPMQSMRLAGATSRTGGGFFDQELETLEIRELTESAVTLIAHIVKIEQTNQVKIEVAHGIVEQVCEVEEAKAIAIREGLLTIFVQWIRSGDVNKIRPAASALRYLISTDDQYMAGWIHSQVINEGAIEEVVKLLNESVGHDVRVAVSQMLYALCVSSHTRDAVVDANCVSYLIALLYEHTAPDSEEMVYCAVNALLHLAASSIMRAGTGMSLALPGDSVSKSKIHDVMNEMVEGWAHGSFVQIALKHTGRLRAASVEALRVLSEDTNLARQTRLQLCRAGAAEALGSTIMSNDPVVKLLEREEPKGLVTKKGMEDLSIAIKETYEALRGLANILESQRGYTPRKFDNVRRKSASNLKPHELLVKGCIDIVQSGGLSGILWVSSLINTSSSVSKQGQLSYDKVDLVEESCRLLANLSPLLLSESASSGGVTRWVNDVFDSLDGVLQKLLEKVEDVLTERSVELSKYVLKGMIALASYEPLKIQLVNRTLPRLLFFKSMGGERNDLATASNQVLHSLGFTEDEITVQLAGNNPQLLVDWFCLQRALVFQALGRAEMRTRVADLWQVPFNKSDTEKLEEMLLIRQVSHQTDVSTNSSLQSETDPVLKDLFTFFTNDYDSKENISTILRQYSCVYENAGSRRVITPSMRAEDISRGRWEYLISPYVFPLNDIDEERSWILDHRAAMESTTGSEEFTVSGTMPERVEKLLDTCFPSRILRRHILPINDLRPESTFDFRALMMPKRRYFSFRREGQLLARLCDKQAKSIDSEDVHWTLGFTNSTFAGEFVESLVQTLYLCPMIRGLSFFRTLDWASLKNDNKESDMDDGSGFLANLTGSLPPWISFLTFDNMLCDRDLLALVAILETMGKLSSGQELLNDSTKIGQSQGKFSCLCIRNSPQIDRDVWGNFFQALGVLGPISRSSLEPPLSALKILDLSGNKMGDEAAALVLELVHDKDSGCRFEELDLSGNRIGRGINVVRVLRAYTEYYRYNQTVGVKMMRKGWKSSLHTLILSENDLFLGQAGLEILALLKYDALCLRLLDLSNNGLEGDTYQLLASSLLKNTALGHLNLSDNKFSLALIDVILDHLNQKDVGSCLSFLLFENNVPLLSEIQEAKLSQFLSESRKNAIERYIKEIEALPKSEDGAEMAFIDEETSHILARSSFTGNRSGDFLLSSVGAGVESDENMITVLFSAPLVFSTAKNELYPFAKLDFEMERELLWQCMKEASRDIEMVFDNAHHSRLLATLTRRCSVLHYSGHGHPTLLPFEDGMGGPNWLDVQDIKELILKDGDVPFKFVFVSACHSGLAGETFASAGVPHVVCCKQESELKDTAALAFTRSFYLALLVGHTVKESFEQGCKAVRLTPNLKDSDKEMEKFVLLPKDGNHNVPVFRAKSVREWPKQSRNYGPLSRKSSRRRGSRSSLLAKTKSLTAILGAKSSELSVRNMMQEDPSPTAPQFFLGREVEMYYVISALLKLRKRLVTVYGETGIGRSSLACAICHYINERASTIPDIQQIYFIKPRHGGQNFTCRSLLRQLLDKLEENGKCRPTDEDVDTETLLNIACKSLKQDKCLIVFDHAELLESSDESKELPMILSTIMYETKQVKVIITARCSIGQPSIGGQVEHSFRLGPLTFSNTVKLFSNLCPHLHTPTERVELSKALVIEEDQEDLLPGAAALKPRTKRIFSMIGNGVPARVEKCAYSISSEDLSTLRNL